MVVSSIGALKWEYGNVVQMGAEVGVYRRVQHKRDLEYLQKRPRISVKETYSICLRWEYTAV
jgi:hypothetical protein